MAVEGIKIVRAEKAQRIKEYRQYNLDELIIDGDEVLVPIYGEPKPTRITVVSQETVDEIFLKVYVEGIAKRQVAKEYDNTTSFINDLLVCRPPSAEVAQQVLDADPQAHIPERLYRTRNAQKRCEHNELSDTEKELYDHLSAVRAELADDEGVRPFHYASNAALRELAKIRPRSKAEFLAVRGLGITKWERWGERVLEIVGEAE